MLKKLLNVIALLQLALIIQVTEIEAVESVIPEESILGIEGKADILWRNPSTGQNQLWTMDGLSISGSYGLSSVGIEWNIAGRGDFNGDDHLDILWRNRITGVNYIWLMDGDEVITKQAFSAVTDLSWQVKGVTDFNGDGKDDILWHHAQRGQTHIYLMDGFNIIGRSNGKTVSDLNWHIKAMADVNADGKSDIIWRNLVSGLNYIWLMEGTTITKGYGLNNVPIDWDLVGAGDLNGDGSDDLVWRNNVDGRNWAHFMENGIVKSSQQINTVNDSDWKITSIADFDGNGKADIFWHNQNTGLTYIYLMNGTEISGRARGKIVDSAWQVISVSPRISSLLDVAQEYYNDKLSSQVVQSHCLSCHSATGSAQDTRLKFVESSVSGFQQINKNSLATFIDDFDTVIDRYGVRYRGSSLISKVINSGDSHGGGIIFDIFNGKNVEQFQSLEYFPNNYVFSPPTPPIVNAGNKQSIFEGESITLIGSGLATDGLLTVVGAIDSYSWTQTAGTPVIIHEANSAEASFIAPDINADETLTFEFTVTDKEGNSASDFVSVVIKSVRDNSIYGSVSYEKFKVVRDNSNGGTELDSYNIKLDVDNPEYFPARRVVVNLNNASKEILATTVTNDEGTYYFNLTQDMLNQPYYIEVVATLEFDNDMANSVNLSIHESITGNNIYRHSTPISLGAELNAHQQDVQLTAAWSEEENKFDYQSATAQPFVILDHLLSTTEYFNNALGENFAGVEMPKVVWATDAVRPQAPSSFYTGSDNVLFIDGGVESDNVRASEWNPVLISHEFTHFYMSKVIGRNDSLGLAHGAFSASEPTLALSEGFATAIGFSVESKWEHYGLPTTDLRTSMDDFYNIANNGRGDCSTQAGEHTLPCLRYNYFTEQTLTYFLLSFLDEKKQSTLRTTNMNSDYGFNAETLVLALKLAADKESMFTLMSVYEALIENTPELAVPLAELSDKLNLKFTDQWGANISSLDNVMIDEGIEFPSEAYAPFYVDLVDNIGAEICFDDSIFDPSDYAPGGVRYAKYNATSSGSIKVSLAGGLIGGSNTSHEYTAYGYLKGSDLAQATINNSSGELGFNVEEGNTYSIRLVNNDMLGWWTNVNGTFCPTVTAHFISH